MFIVPIFSSSSFFLRFQGVWFLEKFWKNFQKILSQIYRSKVRFSTSWVDWYSRFFSIFPIFPSKLRKISLKTTTSKSTQPERKELEGWFQRHSTRISKRNIARPRISKISPTGSEQPLDSKSTQPQRKEIEEWFQRRSARIPKCNNVVSDTEPLGSTVREIQPSKHVISGTEVDRKKFQRMSADPDWYLTKMQKKNRVSPCKP